MHSRMHNNNILVQIKHPTSSITKSVPLFLYSVLQKQGLTWGKQQPLHKLFDFFLNSQVASEISYDFSS